MKKSSPIILLLLSVLTTACNTIYNPQSVEYADYRVRQQPVTDSSLVHLLSPYSKSMYASMNEVIGNVAVNLERKQPEGTLGNLMADVILNAARTKFGQHVDVGVVNAGGVRIDQIPPGPLTRGKIFELSPFDNTIVLLTIKGNVLKQFLDHVAARGGWPVAGMKMQIADKKARNIIIGDKPLDETAEYVMAVPDYVANGGDESFMLRDLPRQDRGFLFRDEILAYVAQLQKEGKKISSAIEGRVTTN